MLTAISGFMYSKYRFLSIFFVFLGINASGQSADTVKFIHMSDPHICFLEDFHSDIQQRRKHYGNGVQPLVNFFKKFSERTDLKFISITGDLIDFYQGAAQNGDLIENQIEQFIPILQHSKVPVYMNLGNHDIASYIIENDRHKGVEYYAQQARAAWIRTVNCFEKGTYYSKNLQVGSTSYRLIFLDNGYRFEGEQLEWLEWQLSQSENDVELVFMHIPFLSEKNQHTDQQKLFDTLLMHKSAKLVLAGHEHINDVRTFEADNNKFTQVLTGAFGRDPNHWRWVELTENSIKISKPGSEATEIIITD